MEGRRILLRALVLLKVMDNPILKLIEGVKPAGAAMQAKLNAIQDLPALLVASSSPAILSGEADDATAPVPSLTHAQLRDFVTSDTSLVAALARGNVGPGDCVALVVPSGPIAAVATIALLARCACAPINDRATKDEIISELMDTCAKIVLALDGGAHAPVRAAAEVVGCPMCVGNNNTSSIARSHA